MMLSVNEEEGSVQFGDRVDGLLLEAVEQAVRLCCKKSIAQLFFVILGKNYQRDL
jgi:hypothetical protein